MDWDIEWTSTFFQPDVRGGFNRRLSLMPIVNIPLANSLKNRTNSLTKDSKMVNCFKETYGLMVKP
jgi:hypothetical protein